MTEELKADKDARKALNARLRRAFGFERQDTYPPELTQLVKAARALSYQDTMHNDGTLALVNASELAALRAALASFKEVE